MEETNNGTQHTSQGRNGGDKDHSDTRGMNAVSSRKPGGGRGPAREPHFDPRLNETQRREQGRDIDWEVVGAAASNQLKKGRWALGGSGHEERSLNGASNADIVQHAMADVFVQGTATSTNEAIERVVDRAHQLIKDHLAKSRRQTRLEKTYGKTGGPLFDDVTSVDEIYLDLAKLDLRRLLRECCDMLISDPVAMFIVGIHLREGVPLDDIQTFSKRIGVSPETISKETRKIKVMLKRLANNQQSGT